MRAVVLRGTELVVDEVAEPVAGPGQALLEIVACGICGSDLHCRHHAARFVQTAARSGLSFFDFDPARDLVMGHEFTARVLEGEREETEAAPAVRPGDLVAVMPMVRTPERVHSVGYSNEYPGGYAERVVVDSFGLVPLPVGADPVQAALTEPLAVGLHAVQQSHAVDYGSAIVIGCGPVGLAVVAALALRDVPLIVAADFSPARRALAARLGAHVVVDPRELPPEQAWRDAGGSRRTTVFDAVGVPGIISQAMAMAPPRSEVVVVGVCMEPDSFEPTIAIMKQLSVHFVLGWSAEEFRACLDAIAAGTIDAAALITGQVDLDGTPAAFDELGRPDAHAKIIVRPNGLS